MRKWLTGCIVHRWVPTGFGKTACWEQCKDCGHIRQRPAALGESEASR